MSSTKLSYSAESTSFIMKHVTLLHPRRLSPRILTFLVHMYIEYLFPMMPVVQNEHLRPDSQVPDRLSRRGYTFLVDLYAITRLQLNLDRHTSFFHSVHLREISPTTGEELLTEAMRVRKECEVVEEIGIETRLTSLFVFMPFQIPVHITTRGSIYARLRQWHLR
jgi:hypothetical protein